MTATQQVDAIKAVCDAILDTVRLSSPLGAPAGPMYAAMMAQGFTLEQFETVMGALVKAGKLRKSGDLYYSA